MAAFVNTFFEKRARDLFDLAELVEKAFSAAGIDYRVIGGLSVYLYVEEAQPDAGRLTKDIDIVVRREDLEKIAQAVEPFDLTYRHAAGVDMLVRPGSPSNRRAVHLIFEPTSEIDPYRILNGIRVVPLSDLIRMKLTSFRAKDEAHVNDLDEAGLITPEIEATLPPPLRARLAQARVRDRRS